MTSEFMLPNFDHSNANDQYWYTVVREGLAVQLRGLMTRRQETSSIIELVLTSTGS